jgi:hypothetical protein
MPDPKHIKASANDGASASGEPTAAQKAIEYTLTVQARAGRLVEEPKLLDAADVEYHVASLLTARGISKVYTSATAEISTPPKSRQYVLDFSVDTFRTALRSRRNSLGVITEESFVAVELSITLRHPASRQILGKHALRRESAIGQYEAHPDRYKRLKLYEAVAEFAAFVATDLQRGVFGAAVQAQPPTPGKDLEQPEWETRLLDAQDAFIETGGHSEAWYENAARAKGREILEQAAVTRRKEAQRSIRTKDIEAEYERTAAYGASRYGLDAKEVVVKLRKFDEREFKLLDLAIRQNQEVGTNGKPKLEADLDRSEEQGPGISDQARKDSGSRKLPTWGGHNEERW